MRVIGFVGLMGSGKGTAGDLLVERYGFIAESFARPLKDACASIFGWDRELLEGATRDSRAFRETPDTYWSKVYGRPFTPREALQKMGTEAGRNVFHTNLWTASLGKRLDPSKNYVITDVRFPNEVEYVQSIGADVIVVERGAKPAYWNQALILNQTTNWDGSVQQIPAFPNVHYSEWAWIGYPSLETTIRNDTTIHDLESTLSATLVLQHLAV